MPDTLSPSPAQRQLIPLARTWMDHQEAEASARVIASGWITQGPEVAAFEREFADYVGAPFACAVSNCTTALHLALLALKIGQGDEVITVSHSYIATANAILYCSAVPVFADIETDGFNMDPKRVESLITPRTKAILCVHQMGMPCDVMTLRNIADRHGLALIEDAACAIGSEFRKRYDAEAGEGASDDPGDIWHRIGDPIGDVVCFSFHPRKVISTGDGGMLTTRDAGLDARFRLLRQHGMDVPDRTRHLASQVQFEQHNVLGYNYRLTDIQAAIGRVQLTRLPQIIAARRAKAAIYAELLAPYPEIMAPRESPVCRSNWQSYCVMLPENVEQKRVMQFMLDRGIATRRGIMCAHREAVYADRPLRQSLAVSERAQDRGLILPLFPQLDHYNQQDIIHQLLSAMTYDKSRRQALRHKPIPRKNAGPVLGHDDASNRSESIAPRS